MPIYQPVPIPDSTPNAMRAYSVAANGRHLGIVALTMTTRPHGKTPRRDWTALPHDGDQDAYPKPFETRTDAYQAMAYREWRKRNPRPPRTWTKLGNRQNRQFRPYVHYRRTQPNHKPKIKGYAASKTSVPASKSSRAATLPTPSADHSAPALTPMVEAILRYLYSVIRETPGPPSASIRKPPASR